MDYISLRVSFLNAYTGEWRHQPVLPKPLLQRFDRQPIVYQMHNLIGALLQYTFVFVFINYINCL